MSKVPSRGWGLGRWAVAGSATATAEVSFPPSVVEVRLLGFDAFFWLLGQFRCRDGGMPVEHLEPRLTRKMADARPEEGRGHRFSWTP